MPDRGHAPHHARYEAAWQAQEEARQDALGRVWAQHGRDVAQLKALRSFAGLPSASCRRGAWPACCGRSMHAWPISGLGGDCTSAIGQQYAPFMQNIAHFSGLPGFGRSGIMPAFFPQNRPRSSRAGARARGFTEGAVDRRAA